jgi:hypothetical protein
MTKKEVGRNLWYALLEDTRDKGRMAGSYYQLQIMGRKKWGAFSTTTTCVIVVAFVTFLFLAK